MPPRSQSSASSAVRTSPRLGAEAPGTAASVAAAKKAKAADVLAGLRASSEAEQRARELAVAQARSGSVPLPEDDDSLAQVPPTLPGTGALAGGGGGGGGGGGDSDDSDAGDDDADDPDLPFQDPIDPELPDVQDDLTASGGAGGGGGGGGDDSDRAAAARAHQRAADRRAREDAALSEDARFARLERSFQGLQTLVTGVLSQMGARPGHLPFALPSLDVQFGWLEDKYKDAALAGRLAPEHLIHFVPPTHGFFKEVTDATTVALVSGGDADGFKAVRPKKSEQDVVKRFVASIPSYSVFSVAWMNLATFMCHGTANDSHALYRALIQYMEWVADWSTIYTWESIVRYHIRFSSPHFAAGAADPAIWATPGDSRMLAILVRRPVQSATASKGKRSSASGSSGSRSASGASSSKAEGRSKVDPDAPCLRWNHGQCVTAKCTRPHVCSLCGGKHRLREGHKA